MTSVPDPGGLVLRPFRATRFDPARAGDLATVLAPPYDVIDEEMRERLEAANAHNVVRLTLPRDDGGDRYEHAARTLHTWRGEGILVTDPEPALYVYEEVAGEHVQRGLLGALGLAAPDAGVVLPHENTMAGPVADRLALTHATGANLEPIFLVYDGGGPASDTVRAAAQRPPLVEVRTPDGLVHRLWNVSGGDALAAVAEDLRGRRAVIADGHHRYATYLQYQQDRHAAGSPAGPWDLGLTLLVDVRQFGPAVHAIHRVVPGLSLEDAVARASRGFEIRAIDDGLDVALGLLADAGRDGPAFLLADPDTRHLVTSPDPAMLDAAVPTDRSPAWRSLDVSVAHYLLVRDLWGLVDDERTVDFQHDPAAAVAAAGRSGGTALLLNPTPVEDVVAVAAAGERMPRKSTLFTPKPATGMVLRLLEHG